MDRPHAASAGAANTTPLLEVIRQTEGKGQRRLAVEGEAAHEALAAAERRAHEMITAAEAEGQRQGEEQCQAALAEAEAQAQEIVQQARAQAELLQKVGVQHLPAAVQRVVALVAEVHV